MKMFTNCAAQGDVMLRRIDKLPAGVTQAKADKGVYIVAHSETGHNHVIAECPNVRLYDSADPFVSFWRLSKLPMLRKCCLSICAAGIRTKP